MQADPPKSILQKNIDNLARLGEERRLKELNKAKIEEDNVRKMRELKERVVKGCAVANKGAKGEPEERVVTGGKEKDAKRGFLVKRNTLQEKGAGVKGGVNLPSNGSVLDRVGEEREVKHHERVDKLRSKTVSNIRDRYNKPGEYHSKEEISNNLAPIIGKHPNRLPQITPKLEQNSKSTTQETSNTHTFELPTPKTENLDKDEQNEIQNKQENAKPSMIKKNIESLVPVKPRSYNYICNVTDWIKKNRLDEDAKVFIVNCGYPQIKNALLNRGWIENPDYSSNCFHFKFTLKSRDIDYATLAENQIVNHFGKATTITTKSGLCKSLKSSIWACDTSEDDYFPKCYESFENTEFEAFVHQYKLIRAEGVLKKVIHLADSGQRDGVEYKELVGGEVLKAALSVAEKRLMDIDDIIDLPEDWQEITEREWAIIGQGEKTQEDLQELIRKQNAKRYEKLLKKKKKKKKKKTKVAEEMNAPGDDEEDDEEDKKPEEPRPEIEMRILALLDRLKQKYPQTTINGMNNIWITKPAGLSRGRGIRLYNSLVEITQQVKSKDMSWVIQKYIENPLLYKNRKLDIRQWVLVTDWNPMCVWFYGECYIRLSANDYNSANLKDRYSHLTNNSVNKHAQNFEKDAGFLSQEDFAEYIRGLGGFEGDNPFYEKIQPRMKEIVINSLSCVQDMVENRKNSSEIYGYDFCVDDQLGVWLIEINSSPAWDYSSSVTERLIKMASEDYIKVIIDYGTASKKKKKNIDTGLFVNIMNSKVTVEKAKETLATELVIVGQSIENENAQKSKKNNPTTNK
jgi:tubulin monoglycylase TTLL3/8